MISTTRPRPEPVHPVAPGKRRQRIRAARWQRFINSLPLPVFIRKAVVLSIGVVIVVVGLIMVPLPGPGWLVVFGGLAILATEFTWAQLLKRKMMEFYDRSVIAIKRYRRDRRKRRYYSSSGS